jgi:hypothetical protein
MSLLTTMRWTIRGVHLKGDLAANRQRPTIGALAPQAESGLLALSPQQTRASLPLPHAKPGQNASPPFTIGGEDVEF